MVITKYGIPFVELVRVRGVGGMDEERAAKVRHDLGLDGLTVVLSPAFDDPALSLEVLGLTD